MGSRAVDPGVRREEGQPRGSRSRRRAHSNRGGAAPNTGRDMTQRALETLPGLPPAVQRYLIAVTERIVSTLGQPLVAIYPTGSLALRGYRHGRSDIDLMAITDPIGDGPVTDLVSALGHRALPCPATGLEFVLYPRATVVSAEPAVGYLLNLNTGAQLPA